jgi:hypothetical protein
MAGMQLLRKYAHRPGDQQYASFDALATALERRQETAVEVSSTADTFRVVPTESGDVALHGAIESPLQLNNWTYRQLCRLVHAPVEFTSSLSPETMCLALNEKLAERVAMGEGGDGEEADAGALKLLLDFPGNGDQPTMRAMTSTRYRRVWDATIVDALKTATEDSIVQPFRLFAGEQDMFACLVNGNRPIYSPHAADTLYRGMFAWNSEVGARTFGIARFYFRAICGNCVVFGMRMDQLVHGRHFGDMRRIAHRIPEFVHWCETPALPNEEEMIRAARAKLLGVKEEEIVDVLFRKYDLTKADATGAVEFAHVDENESRRSGDSGARWNSVWGVLQGITRLSQCREFQNERVALDMVGTKLFESALSN